MNIWVLLVISFFLPFIVSFFLTPQTIRLAERIDAIDVPDGKRRIHEKPMPRIGGIAIAISIITTILLIKVLIPITISSVPFVNREALFLASQNKLLVVVLGGVLVFLLGFLDDILNLRAIIKLIAQIIIALIVFLLGIRLNLPLPDFIEQNTNAVFVISLFCSVIWLVVITNIINLLDGLDGLAAGVSAISALAISYAAYIHGHYIVTIVMLIIAGGVLGFLPFNFHPAKTFMGDCGALFIGFMIAEASIIGPAKKATLIATIVLPILVLGLPILDTGMAMFRRFKAKRSILSADKSHIHHKVNENGMGQTRSVLILYSISGVMSIGAINFSREQIIECLALFVLAIILITVFVASNTNSTFSEKSNKKNIKEIKTRENELDDTLRRAREDIFGNSK